MRHDSVSCTGHIVVQTVFTERLSFTPGSAFQGGSDANSVLFSALQDEKAGFLSILWALLQYKVHCGPLKQSPST